MKQQKLRIAHVTNNYTPFKGGVVQAIKAIVREQEKKENSCLIITLDFAQKEGENTSLIKRIPTFFKCTYAENQIAIPWRVRYNLRTILAPWQPSVMHVHHPFLLGRAAVRLANQKQIPVVFSFHTMYEEHVHYIKVTPYISKPIARALVRSFCNKVDNILVPNDIIKKYVEDHDIQTPITILPNPIGNDIVPINEPVIKKYLSLPLKLLIVSRLVPEKNIEAIIDCMRIIAVQAELIIAGYGYWQSSLEVYIKKNFAHISSSITFCINPNRQKLVELYAWADFFLFASRLDTQGLVIAEAMAHGTPVIALKGPGQDSIIVDYYNGFLVDSVVHMATIIYRLTLNPNMYIAMQKGALETSQKYRAHVIVQQLNDHYHELIEKYKPKSWYSMFLKSIP
ncbi:MAG TPA: glycosyltransferase [Patescibacteria group bacterium]|jgi:glycosyltransferase involved in cell wall biosynthesis|nr:glycosyltransferase [Patescibacteria group bacterium]